MFWRLKWDKQTFAKQYMFKRLWLHKTSVTNKIRFPVPHFTLCIVWWGGESINRGEWENVAEILETIYLPSLENCILYFCILYFCILYLPLLKTVFSLTRSHEQIFEPPPSVQIYSESLMIQTSSFLSRF